MTLKRGLASQKSKMILLKKSYHFTYFYRRNDLIVKPSASQSVDLRFIPQVESYQMTLKNGIHSFSAWRSAHRDRVDNKPASLLVVSLGKALNKMPPSLCGRKAAGPSSLPVVVAQSEERHANRA